MFETRTYKSTHGDIRDTWLDPMVEFRKKEVKPNLKLKFMELYIVRACLENGDVVGEPRFTDDEHLETCIKYIKHDMGTPYAYVNHASMCFNGYLTNGDYMGRY